MAALKFGYEARDVDKKGVSGVIEAKTLEEAIFILIQHNLYPTRVEQLTKASYFNHQKLEKLKKIRDRLLFEQPQQEQQSCESQTKSQTKSKSLSSSHLMMLLFLLWVAILVVYLLLL